MKRVVIIDGNPEDESKIKDGIGDSYDVTSVSHLDINNLALSTVISIVNTMDSLEVYSGGHSLRVAQCARDIAANLGWDENRCQNLYFVAILHDIGMITVSDSIRNKPGRLIDEEYDQIKLHTVRGEKMLHDISMIENLSDGILYHHERWDGKGYPEGLSKDEIPLIARVIAVADAYDAMSSDRVYRSRLSVDKIISEFVRCSGTQFDPEIADVFVFMLKDGYTVDPEIEQTKEASDRAVRDGGLRRIITSPPADEDKEGEMDTLTGLFTRSYLNTRVGNKISSERSGALMLISLMGYDRLYDKHGKKSCDEVIRDFSDRLRSTFRGEDVICRVAPDMFAVYVSGDSGKGVIEKKARLLVEMPGSEEEMGGYYDLLSIQIGISMCQEDGLTFEELYQAAQKALGEASVSGGNTYRFSDQLQ